MSAQLAVRNTQEVEKIAEFPLMKSKWSRDQIELVKRTICKGASDDQMMLFEYVCTRTGLDPFMKQIYGIIRMTNNKDTGKKDPTMTIQTSIDGLRLIADRTGNYLPGRDSTFAYDKDGRLFSATSYIKKWSRGSWHEVSATAIYSEYKPKYPNDFWTDKPHIMLAKCAEALALRKAFPAEMSGVYAKEELDQNVIDVSEVQHMIKAEEKAIELKITQDQIFEIEDLIAGCSKDIKEKIDDYLVKQGFDGKCSNLTPAAFDSLKARILLRKEEAAAPKKETIVSPIKPMEMQASVFTEEVK